MEIILSGLLVNLLTFISKKTGLSWTVMSVLLSLFVGTMYYILTEHYAVTYQQLTMFVAGAYATSQFVYNLLKEVYPAQPNDVE